LCKTYGTKKNERGGSMADQVLGFVTTELSDAFLKEEGSYMTETIMSILRKIHENSPKFISGKVVEVLLHLDNFYNEKYILTMDFVRLLLDDHNDTCSDEIVYQIVLAVCRLCDSVIPERVPYVEYREMPEKKGGFFSKFAEVLSNAMNEIQSASITSEVESEEYPDEEEEDFESSQSESENVLSDEESRLPRNNNVSTTLAKKVDEFIDILVKSKKTLAIFNQCAKILKEDWKKFYSMRKLLSAFSVSKEHQNNFLRCIETVKNNPNASQLIKEECGLMIEQQTLAAV
jgi:hypothetical protein